MTVSFVDVDVPIADCYVPPRPRSVQGGVIHNSVSMTPAVCRPDASWHWQIVRDGTIWRHVEEELIAYHVRAGDRWLPPWVPPTPYPVSDVNVVTIGIELESYAGAPDCPAEYVPYTEAQYAALPVLVADIESRWGPLWWVGHGELQADRRDPVGWDWQRAGFGPREGSGRRFLGVTADQSPPEDQTREPEQPAAGPPQEEDMLTTDQKAILVLMDALHANADSIQAWIGRLGRAAELGRTLVAARAMSAAQRRAIGAELAKLAD